MAEEAQNKLTVGDEAQALDKPVRIKTTYGDGKWSKATVTRIPAKSELAEGESVEILDEPGEDVYGLGVPPEYGQDERLEAAPQQAPAAPKQQPVKSTEVPK